MHAYGYLKFFTVSDRLNRFILYTFEKLKLFPDIQSDLKSDKNVNFEDLKKVNIIILPKISIDHFEIISIPNNNFSSFYFKAKALPLYNEEEH